MRTRLVAITIAVVIAAVPAHAEKTPATLQLGAQLSELMRVRTMVDAILKQCNDPEGSSADAKSSFTSSPGSFGGISPQSAYWPEVEAIYTDYRSGMCTYLTVDGFLAYYAGVLAEKNSEEDLRAALRFYSSSAGKRFRESVVFASVAFQDYASESMKRSTTEATEKYQTAMRSIIRRYKKDPR
jgi:hypothetical protein